MLQLASMLHPHRTEIGDLRICTDFHWVNATKVKDALPHQAIWLPLG